MGWDELISDWEQALSEIESALASGDWETLETVPWPEPEPDMPYPSADQRRRAAELRARQSVAATEISTMLESVGRELRDAATVRGARHAYEASTSRNLRR